LAGLVRARARARRVRVGVADQIKKFCASGARVTRVVLLSAVATVLYGISLWLVETYSPD
jgi:hypothetical protein